MDPPWFYCMLGAKESVAVKFSESTEERSDQSKAKGHTGTCYRVGPKSH